jgi:hypothetical protein
MGKLLLLVFKYPFFCNNFNFLKIVAPYFGLAKLCIENCYLALVFREKNTLKVGLFFFFFLVSQWLSM